jgi:iron complex transport system substrate-binding protein
VTLTASPRRIVAYDATTVEILFALGAGDRVVGTHSFVTYPPEVSSVPKVGDAFTVSLEKVAELQPDLFAIFYDRFTPDVQRLGVPVLYLETSTTLKAVPERIRVWGRILQMEAKAEEVARGYEARLAALQSRLADVPQGPRVLHEVGDLWVAGTGTFEADVYAVLKAQNVAAKVQSYAQLSTEEIVALDPQVVVTTYPGAAQAFAANPAFKDLSAVKNKRVVEVDGATFSTPGLHMLDALDALAKLLYRDRFTGARTRGPLLSVATPAPEAA